MEQNSNLKKFLMSNMIQKRKRATAIVETDKGILLVSHSKRPIFMLPGGGVKRGEHSICAVVRELYEETGLHSSEVKYLFDLTTTHHEHKVFLIKPFGELRKRHETKHIAFWNNFSSGNLKIAWHVQPIIKKYYEIKESK